MYTAVSLYKCDGTRLRSNYITVKYISIHIVAVKAITVPNDKFYISCSRRCSQWCSDCSATSAFHSLPVSNVRSTTHLSYGVVAVELVMDLLQLTCALLVRVADL